MEEDGRIEKERRWGITRKKKEERRKKRYTGRM
jgi:hypothetical protein